MVEQSRKPPWLTSLTTERGRGTSTESQASDQLHWLLEMGEYERFVQKERIIRKNELTRFTNSKKIRSARYLDHSRDWLIDSSLKPSSLTFIFLTA